MTQPNRTTRLSDVVSPREARLLFWLALIALFAVIANLAAGTVSTLSGPAIILFVAWLMAYVLQPLVDWLARHMPFKSRGLAVAITYVLTIAITFVVLLAAGLALLNAAIALAENLPTIIAGVRTALTPVFEALDLPLPPDFSVVDAIARAVAENGQAIVDAAKAAVSNIIVVIASLFTAVIISIGLAVGQVSLLGWLRRFLPERTYFDLAELERAIAVSFGGFIRGRGLIGLIYGAIVAVAAFVLGVPLGPLIAVIAGLIVFIPWIGPLLGWAVLPAFAVVLAPDAVVPSLVISLTAAVAVQLVVTQLVMGRAVEMSPVAVFSVVIIGTALAGILGAIFAIPTAAAILAVTDYLRQRDVLLRAERREAGDPNGESVPDEPSEGEDPDVATPAHAG